MAYLRQNPETGYFTDISDTIDGEIISYLINVHSTKDCIGDHPCAVHNNASIHALCQAPMLWREDRNILERICEHGIGHPDYDSANYLESIGQGYQNVHGCDGCCWTED